MLESLVEETDAHHLIEGRFIVFGSLLAEVDGFDALGRKALEIVELLSEGGDLAVVKRLTEASIVRQSPSEGNDRFLES